MLPDVAAVYQQLYDAHACAVLAYLNNKLRDPEVAEDVAQDAWEKAHRFLPDVLAKGGDGGKPWLMRVATTAMLDHFRRVKARPQTSDLDDVLASGSIVPAALLDWETPEGAAVQAEGAARTGGQAALLLEMLPRAYRLVLWLYEWRGYPYEQIAVALQTTIPAIKSRLYRAREAQRVLWERERQRQGGQGTRSGGVEVRLWRYVAGGRDWALAHPDDCWHWTASYGRARGCAQPHLSVHSHEAPAPGTQIQPTHTVGARRLMYAVRRGVLPPWVYLAPCPTEPLCINPAHTVPKRLSGNMAAHAVATPYFRCDPATDQPASSRLGRTSDLAPRLRQRRLQRGQRLEDVARLARVSKSTVSLLELGLLVAPPLAQAIEDAIAVLEARHTVVSLPPERLRERRCSFGLTRAGLSRLAGLNPGAVRRIETGAGATPPTLRRLQDVFDRLEREQQEAMA